MIIKMKKKEIEDYLRCLKKEQNIRVFTPYKYFKGLTTREEVYSRFVDIVKGSKSDYKDNKSYTTFSTDKNKPTKTSRYTKAFEERYGTNVKSLSQKSKVTGVPLEIIEKVYNKGKAAWRTGHRVGANEEQWGYARVHSFLTLGCTAFSADFSLLKIAVEKMKPKDLQKWFCKPVLCPKKTLETAYYRKIGAKGIIEKWVKKFCE